MSQDSVGTFHLTAALDDYTSVKSWYFGRDGSSYFPGSITGVTEVPATNSALLASTAFVHARTPQVTVGTTAPSSPAVNDIWVDTN
jgi:hypothetical protein